MEIISRTAIPLLPPKSTQPMGSVEGWVVHWVGGAHLNPSPTLGESRQLMQSLQQDAFARGYIDFQYNFAVDPAGRIFEGRGWGVKNGANGTTSSNAHAWAVVTLDGPGVPLTSDAQQALMWLIQQGAQKFGSVSYVKPHRSVPNVATQCPGDERATFCFTLQQHMHDTAPIPTTGKTVDLSKAKAGLVQTTHKGLGQFEGVFEANLPLYDCQATLHGPYPESDGWWETSLGATVRAQVRGTKVVVTVDAPSWKDGSPVPAVHVLAIPA